MVLHRSVLRVAGLRPAAYRLGNTAWKKRRSGGEPLVTLRPTWRLRESNSRPPAMSFTTIRQLTDLLTKSTSNIQTFFCCWNMTTERRNQLDRHQTQRGIEPRTTAWLGGHWFFQGSPTRLLDEYVHLAPAAQASLYQDCRSNHWPRKKVKMTFFSEVQKFRDQFYFVNSMKHSVPQARIRPIF